MHVHVMDSSTLLPPWRLGPRAFSHFINFNACAFAWGWSGRTYTISQAMSSVRYGIPFPQHKILLPKGVGTALWPRKLGRFAELRYKSATDNGDPCRNSDFLDKGGLRAARYEAAPDRSTSHSKRPAPCVVDSRSDLLVSFSCLALLASCATGFEAS